MITRISAMEVETVERKNIKIVLFFYDDINFRVSFFLGSWVEKNIFLFSSRNVCCIKKIYRGQKTFRVENDDFERGGNEDEWRTRVGSLFIFFLQRMHFYFPSVTCWCEKHKFSIFHPLHEYVHGNLQWEKSSFVSLDNRAQLTRKKRLLYPALSARRPHHPPKSNQPPNSSNKEKWKTPRRETFYFFFILVYEKILTTLTLNENEVTINYITLNMILYDGAFWLWCNVRLFECVQRRCNLPMPLNLISVHGMEKWPFIKEKRCLKWALAFFFTPIALKISQQRAKMSVCWLWNMKTSFRTMT
jgi:hypothetical protein